MLNWHYALSTNTYAIFRHVKINNKSKMLVYFELYKETGPDNSGAIIRFC
jgi:hypothetical protein